MFSKDFLFDNQRASDLGLMVCSFNGDYETASGGEIEYNVVKTPNRDRFTFYGAQLNSVIVWNFSICKNPCNNSHMYFDQYEESNIVKWLMRTDGYKPLQFDQNGFEDIFYNVYFNITPHQVSGQTIGFDLVATSDCAYGFTDIMKRKAVINRNSPLILNVHSDINSYIYPHVIIHGSGSFYVSNENDILQNARLDKATEFTEIPTATTITMDSDAGTISGLPNQDNFNWYFLRLVDGINTLTTNSESDIEVKIQYREPRFVRI